MNEFAKFIVILQKKAYRRVLSESETNAFKTVGSKENKTLREIHFGDFQCEENNIAIKSPYTRNYDVMMTASRKCKGG